MIAVDTNIVVRLLTGDDREQYEKAFALFSSNDVFIPISVVLETEWVLRYAYSFDAQSICYAFTKLFGLANVQTENPNAIAQAIEWHSLSMDFADALHLALCQQQEALFSFDAKFAQKAKALGNCPVINP